MYALLQLLPPMNFFWAIVPASKFVSIQWAAPSSADDLMIIWLLLNGIRVVLWTCGFNRCGFPWHNVNVELNIDLCDLLCNETKALYWFFYILKFIWEYEERMQSKSHGCRTNCRSTGKMSCGIKKKVYSKDTCIAHCP